jgi:hypothetical protein
MDPYMANHSFYSSWASVGSERASSALTLGSRFCRFTLSVKSSELHVILKGLRIAKSVECTPNRPSEDALGALGNLHLAVTRPMQRNLIFECKLGARPRASDSLPTLGRQPPSAQSVQN